MKLATFSHEGATRIGVLVGEEIVDLGAAAAELPREMPAFLARGEGGRRAAGEAVEGGEHRLPLASVRLEAPVQRPGKYLGVGLNFRDHIRERGAEGPQAPDHLQQAGDQREPHGGADPHAQDLRPAGLRGGAGAGEIGRRCRHVSREDAPQVIAGYTIVNDVSVRDVQGMSRTMTLGKSYDTHGPMGPWIVTADELGDPHALDSKTWVNGELRQDTNTRELIFDCYAIVEELSRICTLEPGDVVATGTSGGTGNGTDPPRWLQVGDVVRVEIERIRAAGESGHCGAGGDGRDRVRNEKRGRADGASSAGGERSMSSQQSEPWKSEQWFSSPWELPRGSGGRLHVPRELAGARRDVAGWGAAGGGGVHDRG